MPGSGSRFLFSLPLRLLLLGLLVCCRPAFPLGQSPSEAAAAGDTVRGIIECGAGYTSHELYDVAIAVVEVIRGNAARSLLQTADAGTADAPAGTDYILARVRFSYQARGRPGTCLHPLSPEQFQALSHAGETYTRAMVEVPGPELQGGVRSGETREGWVAFVVPTSDTKPLLSFVADDSGAVQHGGNLWFRLY